MKKIIIWGLIILAALIIYNKFLVPRLDSLIKDKNTKVDFLGVTAPSIDAINKARGQGN